MQLALFLHLKLLSQHFQFETAESALLSLLHQHFQFAESALL